MKARKISLMAALAVGVILAYNPALRAEDDKDGKEPGKHEGRPGGDRWAGHKERMERLAEELKLTDEQKPKVEAAFKEQHEKLQGLRDLTPEERQEKFKASREEMNKKMKEILTAEQYEKWEKHRPMGPPGAGARRPHKSDEEKK